MKHLYVCNKMKMIKKYMWIIGVFLLIGLATAGVILTSNKTIPVDDAIKNRFELLGFSNITYENRCDYRECETLIYVNKVGIREKKFLGSYKFDIEGLSENQIGQKQIDYFNKYFLYRLNGRNVTSGRITLTRK